MTECDRIINVIEITCDEAMVDATNELKHFKKDWFGLFFVVFESHKQIR